MSFDLRDLYQQTIIDHNKSPRNYGKMEDSTHRAEGHNPLCGDQIELFLKIDDGKVTDVKFVGKGCAISTASASLLTEEIKGKTVEEVRELFDKFHQMLTRDNPEEAFAAGEELGKLVVFAGVAEYPARIKCATLAWHALMAALENKDQPVSTE